jgi:hypothetical protein
MLHDVLIISLHVGEEVEGCDGAGQGWGCTAAQGDYTMYNEKYFSDDHFSYYSILHYLHYLYITLYYPIFMAHTGCTGEPFIMTQVVSCN